MAVDTYQATYPPAPQGDDTDELHGRSIPDPYRALEDADSTSTKAWVDAQTDVFDEQRAGWAKRENFADRLGALLRSGSIGTPVWRGERNFFTRREPDQQFAVVLTTDPDGTEHLLIDPMEIDPTGGTTLDSWQPSKDGDLLAYQLSEGGTEESILRIMDVETGEIVDGPIDRCRYSPIAWLPAGVPGSTDGGGSRAEAFFYVRRLAPDLVPDDEHQYHRRVYLHRIGTDPSDDVEIFGDGFDKTTFYGVSVSRGGDWLTVTAAQGTAPRNDAWIADLRGGEFERPQLRPIAVGLDAKVHPYVGRDGLIYVWTDIDAPRGRLVVTDPDHLDRDFWRDLVPEDANAVLGDFAILEDLESPVLLVSRTRHALSEITVHELASGGELQQLELPGLGSIGGLAERPEGGHEAWFGYTDHTTPPLVLHYDASTEDLTVWQTSPGSVDVPEVHSRQVEYTSTLRPAEPGTPAAKDGTTVRMVIVSPTKEPDETRPTVLYGYGGFNISLTPAYSANILAWVEAGGVWAVANVRGGSEEGEAWHRAGMRDKKQNVFDDFHAAAQHLVAGGWTTADQLGISGGSNGGLLVGAALTQRPELYRAVVCSAPLLDMVRYEKFGLGRLWSDEYGSAAVPEELEWLLSYSPYHHVTEGVAYPAVLFTIFEGDTRVDTLHARKMAAALQQASAGGPVLLRNERDVGHGARAVTRAVDLSADQLGFLAAHLGME